MSILAYPVARAGKLTDVCSLLSIRKLFDWGHQMRRRLHARIFTVTFHELSKTFFWKLCIAEIIIARVPWAMPNIQLDIFTIDVISGIAYFREIVFGAVAKSAQYGICSYIAYLQKYDG